MAGSHNTAHSKACVCSWTSLQFIGAMSAPTPGVGGVTSVGSTVSLLGRAEGLTSTRTARELVSAESSFRLGSVLRRPAVLEFGARYVRAGFAGECGPRVCVDAPVRGMSRLFTQLITHAAASRCPPCVLPAVSRFCATNPARLCGVLIDSRQSLGVCSGVGVSRAQRAQGW